MISQESPAEIFRRNYAKRKSQQKIRKKEKSVTNLSAVIADDVQEGKI